MLSIFPLLAILTSAIFIFLSYPPTLASEKGSPEYQQAIKAFEEEDKNHNSQIENVYSEVQSCRHLHS